MCARKSASCRITRSDGHCTANAKRCNGISAPTGTALWHKRRGGVIPGSDGFFCQLSFDICSAQAHTAAALTATVPVRVDKAAPTPPAHLLRWPNSGAHAVLHRRCDRTQTPTAERDSDFVRRAFQTHAATSQRTPTRKRPFVSNCSPGLRRSAPAASAAGPVCMQGRHRVHRRDAFRSKQDCCKPHSRILTRNAAIICVFRTYWHVVQALEIPGFSRTSPR